MTDKNKTYRLLLLICLMVETGADLYFVSNANTGLPDVIEVIEERQTTLGTIECRDRTVDSGQGVKIVVIKGAEYVSLLSPTRSLTPVFLYNPLDFENPNNRNNFDVKFECSKSNLATVVLSVNLLPQDINDNAPTFIRSKGTEELYTFNMTEIGEIGTLLYQDIIVEDIDDINNHDVIPACVDISYSTAGSFNSPINCSEYFRFTAEATDPILRAGETFNQTFVRSTTRFSIYSLKEDYSAFKDFTLEIVAINIPLVPSDLSPTLQSQSQNVFIVVTEVQNEPPRVIVRPFSMLENLTVGSIIEANRAVEASDQDERDPNPIAFELRANPQDPNGINYFMLGNVTSPNPNDERDITYKVELLLKNPIDLENLTSPAGTVDVDIIAYEIGPISRNPQNTTATLTVTVLDVNDNIPEFNLPSYTSSVNEQIGDITPGTTQLIINEGQINVRDTDGVEFNTFEVSILPSTFSYLFELEPKFGSGSQFYTLRIDNSALDYEDLTIDNRLTITLLAVDRNRLDFTSTANVEVIIVNQNEGPPVFERNIYSFSIPEDRPINSFVGKVRAIDGDAGLLGEVAGYTIDDSTNTFSIDEFGNITLTSPVNYDNEDERIYQFSVAARDRDDTDQRAGTATVRVNVTNVFDTQPRILNEYSTFVIEESTLLRPSIIIRTENKEEGTDVVFSLIEVVPANINVFEYFSIDRNSGEFLLLKPLDHRDTDNGLLRVLVEARLDVPGVNLFSQAYVNVTVENINNFPPVFVPAVPNNIYYANISEAAPSGTFVFDLNVTDADEPNTPSSTVTFTIQTGGNDFFEIDNVTGVLVVGRVQFQDRSIYKVVVKAADNGEIAKSASATVSVTLLDANNKEPSFSTELYIFAVNASQSQDIGSEVGRVEATDPDSTANLVYSIDYNSAAFERLGNGVSQYDLSTLLSIEESTGIIRVASALNGRVYDRIGFIVKAEDVNAEIGQQTATASVLVTVEAIQDTRVYFEPPWTFDNPVITPTKRETDRLDDLVITLEATDPVTSQRITNFTILPNAEDLFRIDSRRLVTKKPLDYETLPGPKGSPKLVTVTVVAISNDGGRSASATIEVSVTDANDNPPVFEVSNFTLSLRENSGVGTVVATITVTDRDSGTFGLSAFTLEQTEEFIIDRSQVQPNVARIIVAPDTVLDRETLDSYQILLVATDNNGERGNIALANLEVRLTDVNDNSPTFTQDSYRFTVIGTTDVGQNFSREILAVDPDLGESGRIFYYVNRNAPGRGGDYFNIRTQEQASPLIQVGVTEQYGQFFITRSLADVPDGTELNMVVVASDYDEFPLSTSVNVTMVISQPGQDPQPIWREGLPTTVQILENSTIGTFVANIVASPAKDDSGVTYSFITALQTGSDSDLFSLNTQTGEIRTAAELSYNKFNRPENFKSLLILATDTQNTSYTSQFLLTVEVIDIDDNVPTFQNCTDRTYPIPVVVRVMEAEPAGFFVYQVEGCDDDEAPNNIIVYREFAPSPLSPYYALCPEQDVLFDDTDGTFNLDSDTGFITTRRPLDREVRDQYDLCVQALPPGNSRKKRGVSDIGLARELHDVLFIKVVVLDANDNGPRFNQTLVKKVILSYPFIDVSVSEAFDPDLAPNNNIRYTIEDIQFYILGSRAPGSPAAFTINGETGAIAAGLYDYSQFVGGYFEINITATDFYGGNTITDWQIQKVYVTEARNRIRVVLNRPADLVLSAEIEEMIRRLNELEEGVVYYEEMKTSYHIINNEQDPVFDRTDVCLVVVRDDTVIQSADATKFLESEAAVQAILDDYGAREPGPCDPAKSVYPQGWESYWWVLVAFAIFIFVCVLILIFIILSLYSGYKRYMDTRRTYLVPGN